MIRCNFGNKDYFIPGQIQGIFGQRDPMIRHWQTRDPKSDVFSEWCWVSASRLFPMWNVHGLADFSGWTTPSSISFCVFFIKKSTKINGVPSSWLRLYCNSFVEASNLADWKSFSFGMVPVFSPAFFLSHFLKSMKSSGIVFWPPPAA